MHVTMMTGHRFYCCLSQQKSPTVEIFGSIFWYLSPNRLGLNEFFLKFLVIFHWIDHPKNSQTFVEKVNNPDATPLKISIRTHSIPAWSLKAKILLFNLMGEEGSLFFQTVPIEWQMYNFWLKMLKRHKKVS